MKPLTPEEKRVIIDKGTEAPFSGKYENFWENGIYKCRQCGEPLFKSEDKFDARCGWPSFDDEIPDAVKKVPDKDGHRTEIICAKCGAHLGHIFTNEGFTDKNVRYCVNSISMSFDSEKTDTAIFAGGCFWGVEHLMQRQNGVKSVESGYIGGTIENPSYEQVCTGKSRHAEAVRIVFDPQQVSYEILAKLFFEIHDPTQANGQGPDIGDQYRSEVFYLNDQQKEVTIKLIDLLKQNGYKVVTKVTKATTFWPAENYHQNYYQRKGTQPYCHRYIKRF